MMFRGGNLKNAANNAVYDLQQKNQRNRSESERKAATADQHSDFKYVLMAASTGILTLGLLLCGFGILDWAFILVFTIPLFVSVYSMFSDSKNIEAAREEQMKTHMMMKGDKRYWGRGEGGKDE